MNLKNNVLNIIVSENPIIQNIVFKGLKAKKYKDVIYETNQVEVFDVCGAGDVFISALAFEYLNSKINANTNLELELLMVIK